MRLNRRVMGPEDEVEEIFRDFKGRRAGMIKALTTDFEEFYQQCCPGDRKRILCLYGCHNEQWDVNLPTKKVPTSLPVPALGINFIRDALQDKDWLSLVAIYSDAWLLAVAFTLGGPNALDKADRNRLFTMINDLPTIFEVVTEVQKNRPRNGKTIAATNQNPVQEGRMLMDNIAMHVMHGGTWYNPRTLEEVFRDFQGRRAGLFKAFTTDFKEFYQRCDPARKRLCLYGYPDEQWDVRSPFEVPTVLLQPVSGINLVRDMMLDEDWLALLAIHTDVWLLSVAFCFGARIAFDKADRNRLFTMINDLPTICDVVTKL